MPLTPLALNNIGFSTTWLSFRSAPLTWTLSGEFYGGAASTLSASAFNAATAARKGAVVRKAFAQMVFLGDDGTTTAIDIGPVPMGDGYDPLDYWDMSYGAYFFNSKYQLFVQGRTGGDFGYFVVSSPDGSQPWTVQGTLIFHNRGETFILRWDGVSHLVDVFTSADDTPGSNLYALYTYDLNTDSFSSPMGSVDFGRQIFGTQRNSLNSNGIYRFPNNDLIVFYSDGSVHTSNTFYRIYRSGSATWDAEVQITSSFDSDWGNIVPDQNGQDIHVLLYRFVVSSDDFVDYRIVNHTTGITGVLASFLAGGEGVGNSILDGGVLMVPTTTTDMSPIENCVWEATVTGGATTFARGLIPRDPGASPTQNASCAYLILASFGDATLKLIKQVTGPDPASSWTLEALGPTTVSGPGPTVGPDIVTPGDYPLSESGPSGYRTSGYACVGMSTPQAGQTVTILAGEDVICTIVNILDTFPSGPRPEYRHRRNLAAG